MTPDDLSAIRKALEAGDLKHEEIEELLTLTENQQATITELEKRADLNQTWARTHYRGRQKAEEVLASNVAQAIRECAKLARTWPKQHLQDFFPGNEKPDKGQRKLAALVANGIATRIEQELEG